MTITIGWVRRTKDTSELIIASDSRLRSRGALNETQKIFQLARGDCCLGFCGDAQIAYPLFIQVGSALNSFISTRSRAKDITDIAENIQGMLNNIISSWDLTQKEKDEELCETMIMFAGLSWKHKRFDIGVFKYKKGMFGFHHSKARLPHPWTENSKSLVVIGDYPQQYKAALDCVLTKRYGKQTKGKMKSIDFDFEPIEALQLLLTENESSNKYPAIGGALQLLKIYKYGNSLPIVVRTQKNKHFLLGRSLLKWEKVEYPILDLTQSKPAFIYPLSSIPLPCELEYKKNTQEEG